MKISFLRPALLFALILLVACSKKVDVEYTKEDLIGEWILVSEYNDNDLENITNYSCNSTLCHKLILDESSYTYIKQYEDFTDNYEGEYEVQANRLYFFGDVRNYFDFDIIHFTIQSDNSSNSKKLTISYSNEEVSGSYVFKQGISIIQE